MNNKIKIHYSNNKQKTYERFSSYEYPYLSIISPVDITNVYNWTQKNKISVYATLSYCVACSINAIPELKQRIENEEVFEYNQIAVTFSVLRPDNSFGYSRIVEFAPENEFINSFNEAKVEVLSNMKVPHEQRNDVIYLTCLPWIRITSLINPMSLKYPDTIPRIAWGKIWQDSNRYFCDFSIQVHHALADGYHLGQFFIQLEEESNKHETFML